MRMTATIRPVDEQRAYRLMTASVTGDKLATDEVIKEAMADPHRDPRPPVHPRGIRHLPRGAGRPRLPRPPPGPPPPCPPPPGRGRGGLGVGAERPVMPMSDRSDRPR